MSEGGRRYRVLGVLGRGGFGTVFRADLLGEGSFVRPVALKVLNPAMEGVHSVAARLRDEARLLGRIRHRAIVQVDGLVRLDDRWTVVMEYVDGVDLGRFVEKGPTPERAALELAGEVAGALHVAFSWTGDDGKPLGILHRDLKPANLLLTAAGEVKILDFGGARAEFEDREAKTKGMRFGSPGYVAPERIDDEERPEGDVYSLGVVLYELLAGRSFGKPSVREERHAAHIDEVLAHLPPVDPETGALLRRMLAWEPEGRPSAREVERICRGVAARLPGEFLRDWAEAQVPPLLSARTLGDARSEFSSEIVIERVSMPITATPAPAGAAKPRDPRQTFDGLDLDEFKPADSTVGAITADDLLRPPIDGLRPPADVLRPPVTAPPPAPVAERQPPAVPDPPPAPPALVKPARRPAPSSGAGEVALFAAIAVFLVTFVVGLALLLVCSGWFFLQIALLQPGFY